MTSILNKVITAKDIRLAPLDNNDFISFDLLKEEKKAPEPLPPLPDDAEEQLPDFMAGHRLSHVENLGEGYAVDNKHNYVTKLSEANLISSQIGTSSKHRVILDLDFPAALVPSSTPGHSHLYLDKQLTEGEMEKLIHVLHEVGIIAQGNLNQWSRFKALFLRLPWIKKKAGDNDDTPKD